MKIQEVFDNNTSWINEKLNLESDYFEKLAQGQSPEILYIGCSDSRVTAEQMMGANPGDVFVHRNVANMVPHTDVNALAVIDYAVSHLKVNHVVVCGHYYCGGVKAAMGASDLGVINPWLRNIRDVYRMHKEELDAISDEESKYKRLVELNVQEQCMNVLSTEQVQAAKSTRGIQVHGWVFDIRSGKIIDLNIDFDQLRSSVDTIYEIES